MDLALLGAGDLPIVQLWIRSCERVIDKGIKSLSHADRKICKTLSVLDVGYIPKITNAAIFTITSTAKALTDLSIGFCDEVTDAAVQMLMERPNHISSQLSCERVIDKGIKSLFHADRKTCKTLSVLDVGYMPKITNASIFTITSAAKALTDLSIGFCDEVTDAAVQMLMDRPNHNSSQL
ncbi:hypothetical protein CQW23_18162 [Capsicum baccatum]|uniref:F-box/LRR-repeat protein 15-like leucin rich repeat domain-containing protein n=1 Tax=Capsicum baccatum TaxID=33114 RepID=A0A2G2WFW1_CAPBA|nr:hypothetical protein CQW23_18162 [Capsicum baccatum]